MLSGSKFDEVETYLGAPVAKHFAGHGEFRGSVTSWRAVGGRLWFRVRFPADGDEEEFSKVQLLRVLTQEQDEERSSPLGVTSSGNFDTLVGTRVRRRLPRGGEFVGAVQRAPEEADGGNGSQSVRWSDGSTSTMTPCAVLRHAFRGSIDALMAVRSPPPPSAPSPSSASSTKRTVDGDDKGDNEAATGVASESTTAACDGQGGELVEQHSTSEGDGGGPPRKVRRVDI